MIHSSQKNGFSLIELSVALIIIGLIMGPLFTYLNLYYKEKAQRETMENLNNVSMALSQYFKDTGHYPCPAPIDLGPRDSAAGTEGECSAENSGTTTRQRRPGSCRNGICTVSGHDNLEGFDQFEDINQNIKIGGIPYRALGIPYEQTIDGYGNKITYAVTERYATPENEIHLGAISIRDISGNSVVNPEGSGQFILVSHGEDGKGAFTKEGVQVGLDCDPRDGADAENCDLDGEFLAGRLASVPGRTYYDDIVYYKMFGDSLLWQVSPFNETNIYNSTKGNVGIGTDNPREKLDIDGNMRTLGKINAASLCDANGENCFSPSVIGGLGMRCTRRNFVMVGIENASPVCAPMAISGMGNSECPEDEFLAGFTTGGDAICRRPSWRETEETTREVFP